MSKKAAKKVAKKATKKSAKKPARPSGKKSASKASKKPAKAMKPASQAPAPAAPSMALNQRAAAFLKFARKMVDDMAAGIPDARATEQLPGASNHKLWTYGHLANTAAWINSLVTGKMGTVPENYNKLFGMGSTPSSDAAAYPALDDVRAVYQKVFDEVLANFAAMDDAALTGPCAASSEGFASDKLDALLKMAWHEGWHLGQLAALRRGLGIDPMMKMPPPPTS